MEKANDRHVMEIKIIVKPSVGTSKNREYTFIRVLNDSQISGISLLEVVQSCRGKILEQVVKCRGKIVCYKFYLDNTIHFTHPTLETIPYGASLIF